MSSSGYGQKEKILAVVLDKGIYMLMAFLGAMEMEMYIIWDCDLQTLSRIAATRLQKELTEWQVNPPCGFEHKVTESLQRWIIEVHGAPGTLYEGETFHLQVDFAEHYPMEAPLVIFMQIPPLHPHIYSNGHICLDILYDSWSPAMTVTSICISILSMLSSSTVKARPPDDDRYIWNCRNGRSPKETQWWFHDDKV